MLKTGQIKFTKKAAEIAKSYFEKKKVEQFLIAVERSKQKPSGYVGFYKQLLGTNQDPSSTCKVYTNNVEKALKIFMTSLLKEGRLNLISCLSKGCLLYISKAEQSTYEKMKLPETNWPVVVIDERNNSAMVKFIGKMRLSSVDLSDLLKSNKDEKR